MAGAGAGASAKDECHSPTTPNLHVAAVFFQVFVPDTLFALLLGCFLLLFLVCLCILLLCLSISSLLRTCKLSAAMVEDIADHLFLSTSNASYRPVFKQPSKLRVADRMRKFLASDCWVSSGSATASDLDEGLLHTCIGYN